VDGRWHTWIDYDRFHMLVKRWQAANDASTSSSSSARPKREAVTLTPEAGDADAGAGAESGAAESFTRASPSSPVVAIPSDGSEFSFSAGDYMAPTPDWAVYNAPEGGFSPDDVRFRRTANGKAPTAAAAGDDEEE
jgi:hypothetical protein